MSIPHMKMSQHLSLSRHTCYHCRSITIDPETSSKPVKRVDLPKQGWINFRNTFVYTVAEVLQASRDACPLFARIVGSIDIDVLAEEENKHRNLNIDFNLTSITSPTQRTTANVKSAKISCRWADTDEELMDYDAIKENTYAFEAESDDAAGLYVLNRPSYPYVISDDTFEIIRTWLQGCESHADCIAAIQTVPSGVSNPGPSRLLYLDPSAATTRVRIIATNGTEKYTALSYCWGKDSSMQLLRENINAWKEALPFEDLPQTIQDAIITTRRLGLEYLWVDRICIVQDDRDDTRKELSAMARIYQRAFLTISAASAPSAIDGFLQSRSQAASIMQLSRIALNYLCPNGSKGIIGMKTIASRDLEFLPNMRAVESRAWTMQEQILSTRIIHFCTNMLYWKCLCGNGARMHQEGISNTTTPEEEQPTYMEDRDSRFEVMKWAEVVRDYTRRDLSYPADKLVAISALAEKFASIYQTKLGVEQPRYLAGLWEHELGTSLAWYLDPSSAIPQKRVSEYRAPSWSWASVDGVVTGFRNRSRAVMAFEILACGVKLVEDSMPFLSVLSGLLTLKGRVREDIWDRKNQKLVGAMGKDYAEDDAPDGLIDAIEVDLVEDENGLIPVFCLLMGEDGGRNQTPFGLILVREKICWNMYRRVGYFELELFEGSSNVIDFSFDGCEKQVVTIV